MMEKHFHGDNYALTMTMIDEDPGNREACIRVCKKQKNLIIPQQCFQEKFDDQNKLRVIGDFFKDIDCETIAQFFKRQALKITFPQNEMDDENSGVAKITLEVPYEVIGRKFIYNTEIRVPQCEVSPYSILQEEVANLKQQIEQLKRNKQGHEKQKQLYKKAQKENVKLKAQNKLLQNKFQQLEKQYTQLQEKWNQQRNEMIRLGIGHANNGKHRTHAQGDNSQPQGSKQGDGSSKNKQGQPFMGKGRTHRQRREGQEGERQRQQQGYKRRKIQFEQNQNPFLYYTNVKKLQYQIIDNCGIRLNEQQTSENALFCIYPQIHYPQKGYSQQKQILKIEVQIVSTKNGHIMIGVSNKRLIKDQVSSKIYQPYYWGNGMILGNGRILGNGMILGNQKARGPTFAQGDIITMTVTPQTMKTNESKVQWEVNNKGKFGQCSLEAVKGQSLYPCIMMQDKEDEFRVLRSKFEN